MKIQGSTSDTGGILCGIQLNKFGSLMYHEHSVTPHKNGRTGKEKLKIRTRMNQNTHKVMTAQVNETLGLQPCNL